MRQLAVFTVNLESMTIDLSWYADGIYFLKVVGRNGVNSVRLVKHE